MASFPTFLVSGTCLASTIILNRINGKSGYDLEISLEFHQCDEARNYGRKFTILGLNNKKNPVIQPESML
jgi:hypothetical protein